jgi:hypothetical protein
MGMARAIPTRVSPSKFEAERTARKFESAVEEVVPVRDDL